MDFGLAVSIQTEVILREEVPVSLRPLIVHFDWPLMLALGLFLVPVDSLAYGAGWSLPELELPWLIRLLLILGGLCFICAGFYIYEFFIALPGFVIGAVAGGVAMHDENVISIIFIAIVLGMIGAAIALFLYKLLIFLSGALVGALLVAGLFALTTQEVPEPLLVVIGGIVGGTVTLWLWKFLIVIVSSATGALFFGLGTNTLQTVWFIVVLTLAGIAVQYGVIKYLDFEKEGNQTRQKVPWFLAKREAAVGTGKAHTSNVLKDPKKEVCPFCREHSFKASDKCEVCGRMKR